MSIIFSNTEYSWKTSSLSQFLLEGNIPSGWKEFFSLNDVKNELQYISKTLERGNLECGNLIIYPPINQVFRAFYLTHLKDIKAVILGQDPYHNGSAVGLCFSVKLGNKINPSLRNIYKELETEGFSPNCNGDLISWSEQGILLINVSLTVIKGEPNSHSHIWANFSELLINYISDNAKAQWLLFGNNAHTFGKQISNGKVKGIIHKTTHPSPFSAYKSSKTAPAFFGSNVFKKIKDVIW